MRFGPSPGPTTPDVLSIESCHSTWLFDTEGQRFRRVLKGLDLDLDEASTGWRPYYRLDLDTRSALPRLVGEVVLRTRESELLTGFENHSGRT